MWSPTLLVNDPSREAQIDAFIQQGLYHDALQLALAHEQDTGEKHYRWEEILLGLVRQDETLLFG